MLRRLRLTAATVCFALAITLAGLMVRSYWTADYFSYTPEQTKPKTMFVGTMDGTVAIYWNAWDGGRANWWFSISLSPPGKYMAEAADEMAMGKSSFTRKVASTPLIVPAAVFAATGLLLANGRATFSLRAALIATTAFALLLGLHVGLQRAFS